MRFKEIIGESQSKDTGIPGKIEKNVDAVSTGILAQRQIRNTDPYMSYRMGLALAAAARARGNQPADFDQESAYSENFLTVIYTDADEEQMKMAGKMLGVSPTSVTSKKSKEPEGTNKNSPVAKPKRNKYGV